MSTMMTQEILRQEAQLADTKRTLDLDALNGIYADDLLMTGVLGEPTCTKAAIIDGRSAALPSARARLPAGGRSRRPAATKTSR